MARDTLQYDKMVEAALRGVVREALGFAAKTGLPGNHHFYLTFRTDHPGVEMSDGLRAQYPNDMTVVLQHQYWGLEANDDHFVVNLSFSNIPERLKVPYAAMMSFVDPSVKFGLQFQPLEPEAPSGSGSGLSGGLAAALDGAKSPKAKAEAKPAETKAEPVKLPAAAKEKDEAKDKNKPAPKPAASEGDAPADAAAESGEKVVSLDAFRKK